jgi:hypothetical protein
VKELRKAADNKALPIGEAWELLDRAASALSRAGNGWQPIETAPKDRTAILVSGIGPRGRYHDIIAWADDEWRTFDVVEDCYSYPVLPPTHWMPLPAAPHPEQE